MANAQRGDVSIEIDGEACSMRPTFDAVAQIEEECGQSLARIAFDARDSNLRITHAVAIIFHGVAAGCGSVTLAQVQDHAVKVGLMPLLAPVVTFCARFMAGTDNIREEGETEENP